MPHRDSKGYYRLLGLSPEAGQEEIKRAYRTLAKELHPDRHPNDSSATTRFQTLNEAYSVLSDVSQRAQYDRMCSEDKPEESQALSIDPVKCSACGAVSAQPRYVVFTYVISLFLASWRHSFQGVFCPACAPFKALQASTITWLLGWWGIPWGPIWSVGTIYRNLLGGIYPEEINGQLLGRQALYLWHGGKNDLADAVLSDALSFKVSSRLREALSKLREDIGSTRTAPLVNRWNLLRGWSFWAQLAPCLALLAFFVWSERLNIIVATSQKELAHVANGPTSVQLEPFPGSKILANIRSFENFYVLVGHGSNGYVRIITEKKMVGYVPQQFISYGDGSKHRFRMCFPNGGIFLRNGTVFKQLRYGPHELKVENGLSNDAVVKLRNFAGHTVLSFYVSHGDQVDLRNVPAGVFTIQFATGTEFSPTCGYFLRHMHVQRFADSMTFNEKSDGRYRYTSVFSITLNPVSGGKARTFEIDGSNFEQD